MVYHYSVNKLIAHLKTKINSNPRGLYVLLYTEIWELFGRFGITALLVLYLTKMLHIHDARAFTIYSAFIALIYVTPILGGFLSDRFLGFNHAIILGGTIMAIGDSLMVIPKPIMVYLGLAVVAIGNGFFIPTLAAAVGRLYKHDEQGRDTGFTLYYIAKNIGALLAPIFCGIVGQYFGLNYAFALSSMGMISGIIVFCIRKKHLQEQLQSNYLHHSHEIGDSRLRGNDEEKSGNDGNAKTVKFRSTSAIYALIALLIPVIFLAIDKDIDGYLLIAAVIIVLTILTRIAIRRTKTERAHIAFILIMMLFVVVFYAYLSEGGTTLNLFIDRIVQRKLLGITIPTSFFYTLDPIFMIIAGPFLAMFFAGFAKRKHEVSVVSKFIIALFLLSAGFLVFVLASFRAATFGHISMLYVIIAYFMFPIAELCIMPIGLSLTTKYAPKNLEAMMVGIFMLAGAGASYLTGIISRGGQINFNFSNLAGMQHAAGIYKHLFADTAIMLALAGAVLLILKPLLHKLMAMRDNETAAKKERRPAAY